MGYQPDGYQPDGYQPQGYQPDGASAFIPDVRFEFRSRRRTVVYLTTDDGYTFQDAIKDPAESIKVRLDLFSQCANFWLSNEAFQAGEHVRPNRANGYSYECTGAGTSGSREPVWPQSLGATVIDGSVTWTCRAAASNGINAIVGVSASAVGMTVQDVSVSEDAKILATYSGGTEDQDHDVAFSFTLNGVSRVVRQKVCIRKR